MSNTILFGSDKLKIEDIHLLTGGDCRIQLSRDSKFVDKINRGRKFLDELLDQDGIIYGVTTGVGDSCTVEVQKELVEQMPIELVRFHNCGMGNYFSPSQGRAILGTRLASLCNGMSGVSFELLEKLVELYNCGISPRIPEEGSVGASGDLTPLSYLASALIGEGELYFKGQRRQAKEVLDEQAISPHLLKPKEGLAIMNGTAVMTALACISFKRAEYLTKVASRMTSLTCVALQGNDFHFDEVLFSAKPHLGQNDIARRIRSDLISEDAPKNSMRLQDRYSLRCAPHVIGVLQDALPFFRQLIEVELNSTNDNPIVDGVGEKVLHGGHFYGGHIAFAMDAMKNAVANIADLIDRQMALLVDPKFNNGLPANLSGATGSAESICHGFKAVQIGASAWTAEALKLTMPASVFSRSTECHNQDKVSMGTIAARDCLRILQLTEQVAAAGILFVNQAIEIRRRQDGLEIDQLSLDHQQFLSRVSAEFEFVIRDRPLESALRKFTEFIQHESWRLY